MLCKGEEDYRNDLIAAIQLFAPRQNQLCSYHYQLQHPWVYCILLLCCRLCSHIFSDVQSRTLLMQFKTTTSDIITFKEQCISFTLSQSPLSQSSLLFLSLPFQSFVTGHFFLSDLFLYLFLDSYWLMNIFLKLMYSKVGNIIYSANMSTETKTTVKNDNLSILTNPTGLQVHGN